MPLKLKKYDGITALDTAHPLYSKVDRFILFDEIITDLKSGQVYTTTAATIASGDPLGEDVRQFDATGDVLSPSVPIPFPSTVLLIYRQYGSNSSGGSDTQMINLFGGNSFRLEAGNWTSYDYRFTRRGNFGTTFETFFKPYRTGLDWVTQQAEITARRQQPHCTAIDYVSGSTSFWQDGVQHTPTSGSTAPVFTPSVNPVSVQLAATVASGKEWMLAGFVVFNTTLTSLEKESVTQEPWELTNGVEPVEVSISAALTPGATITATLVNYPSLPTTVTVADSRGNDIVLPLNATGATTATFAVPTLAPSNAGQEYLQFGAVNLTFGNKTISSTFNLVSPLVYVNLVAPVATNAFEAWGTDVPVAGEQLTSEGNFDNNGNFAGADPDAAYTCWITRLDGTNHRFTVRQGSAGPGPGPTEGDGILKNILQDIFQPVVVDIVSSGSAIVYALQFDGSNDHGQLASRVIDVESDIEIEFYTPAYIGTAGLSQSIVAQCAASTYTLQEFELYFSGGSGNLVVNIGGTITSVLLAGQFAASTQYRIVLSGSTSTVYNMAGDVIRTTALSRGAARESAAAVTIGARFNGTSMVEHFGGVQRNLKINGVLWPMSSKDEVVQPSTPAGNNMTLFNTSGSTWVTVG